MQGTIVKVAVEEGQQVEEGDLVVVLEAMKMEQPLNAHRSGTVKGLHAEVGALALVGRRDLRDQGLSHNARLLAVHADDSAVGGGQLRLSRRGSTTPGSQIRDASADGRGLVLM